MQMGSTVFELWRTIYQNQKTNYQNVKLTVSSSGQKI